MSKEPVKPNGGLGGLLATLASGDNVSKMLMVLILLAQGGGILNVNRNSNETRQEIEQQQRLAFKQLQRIYDAQKTYIQAVRDGHTDHTELMKALGIKLESRIRVPPIPTAPVWEDEHNHDEGEN